MLQTAITGVDFVLNVYLWLSGLIVLFLFGGSALGFKPKTAKESAYVFTTKSNTSTSKNKSHYSVYAFPDEDNNDSYDDSWDTSGLEISEPHLFQQDTTDSGEESQISYFDVKEGDDEQIRSLEEYIIETDQTELPILLDLSNSQG